MSLEVEAARIAGLRAVAHPLRLQMLSLVTGAPMSAAELARELGVSQALASYHVRRLADAAFVEVVEQRSRRGGRERRYRAVAVDTRWHPPADDDEGQSLMVEALIDQLRRRHAHRDRDRPGLTVDAELWVTPQDWEQARDAVSAATALLHERARPPREPGTVRVAATVRLFPMTSSPPAGPT